MSLGVSRATSVARIGIVGLAATIAFIAVTTDSADARRRRVRGPAYSPPFASIVVDGNSGKTLQQTNADLPRHPASLTKIMTLYMLFERLESGRIKLDTEMQVSEHASEQAPTKLGLREGSTLAVEDAIKGLVTKSANDAAVVIAETLGGSEDKFAQMMTQKARGLGMTKTVYRNASGLPDMEQVTTARDQATLGRAIQDRFPKYYRYFQTAAFNYRGRVIRNHNRLIGRVEGVDGIKTGYTRASGFNLVTSVHRGNRFLVGVVLGGRSGGSRDATMRNLVAEYIDEGATQRTVAAISERTAPIAAYEKVAVAEMPPAAPASLKFAEPKTETKTETKAEAKAEAKAAKAAPLQLAAAPVEPQQSIAAPAKQDAVTLSSGVVATQSLAPIPGSSDPITPTRVKTLQVRAGAVKTASTTSNMVASAMPVTSEPAQSEPTPVAAAPVPTAPTQTASISRSEMPRQPANHGTGQGILGTLPASTMAYADPKVFPSPTNAAAVAAVSSHPATKPVTVASAAASIPTPAAAAPATKTVVRSGWIVQVGAFDVEREARERLDEARGAVKQLGKADPFTEPVSKGNKTMYRARFAGLAQGDAEAACKVLKRNDIPCIAIKN
jgi:D-alanyl-D-alanine carboxypeptidase